MRIFLILLTSFIMACNPAETEEPKPESTSIPKEETPKVIPTETFEALDIEATNKKLVAMQDTLSPREIMGLYYPLEPETNEGNQKIEVSQQKLDDDEVEIQLIHSNLLDDSLLAEKYIMLLQNIKGKWAVISIKKSWKCRENRGHDYWSAEKCK